MKTFLQLLNFKVKTFLLKPKSYFCKKGIIKMFFCTIIVILFTKNMILWQKTHIF